MFWRWKPRARKHVFADHFVADRDVLAKRLVEATDHQLKQGHAVFLLCHFIDTFAWMESLLDESDTGYEVLQQPIDWTRPVKMLRRQLAAPVIALEQVFAAQSIPPDLPRDHSLQISCIIAERHPLAHLDERLLARIHAVPFATLTGFYLSLDQPLLRQAINGSARTLLQQLGMDRSSLITSELISRRVRRSQARNRKTVPVPQPADSAEEWYRLNLPQEFQKILD